MPTHSTLRNATLDANGDISYETRIKLAINEWEAAKGLLPIKKAANRYGIAYSTL
jgi:hypothetical protein